jgi:allantoin racemase
MTKGDHNMRIRVITPTTTAEFLAESEREFGLVVGPRTVLSHVLLDHGPVSIESEYDEAMALPDMLQKVRQAEADGMQAIIINCASDPGIDAARELVSIPVIGVAQASFSLAAQLSQRFSVIAILERDRPDLDRMFRLYGVLDRVASIRVMDIPVLQLFTDRDKAIKAMSDAAFLAVREDRAEAITFDCTGLSNIIPEIARRLSAAGFNVPVINPVAAAMKLAESLVELGLCHSKVTYPDPPRK